VALTQFNLPRELTMKTCQPPRVGFRFLFGFADQDDRAVRFAAAVAADHAIQCGPRTGCEFDTDRKLWTSGVEIYQI